MLLPNTTTHPVFRSLFSCLWCAQLRITIAPLWYALIGALLLACGSPHTSSASDPQKISYEILATHPHDPQIFTQGFIVEDDVITESSGLYAKSFLIQYHALNGEVFKRVDLPKDIFAEGITRFGAHFFMLTWHAGKAFVFDAQTLAHEKTLTYSGQGWGLTHNSEHLISSDGSDTLSFRNPTDFTVVKTLPVKDSQRSWNQLNELEFAEGYIWANVWQSPIILAIDPQTGNVEGIADLTELDRINNHAPGQSVLNGIAYDSEKKAFWVTGKLWPNRYLVRFHWLNTADHASTHPFPRGPSIKRIDTVEMHLGQSISPTHPLLAPYPDARQLASPVVLLIDGGGAICCQSSPTGNGGFLSRGT